MKPNGYSGFYLPFNMIRDFRVEKRNKWNKNSNFFCWNNGIMPFCGAE